MVLEMPGMEDRGMEHRIMLLCAVLVCALVSFLDVANKKKAVAHGGTALRKCWYQFQNHSLKH